MLGIDAELYTRTNADDLEIQNGKQSEVKSVEEANVAAMKEAAGQQAQ